MRAVIEGAGEIARVDGVDPLFGECLAKRARLREACVVQRPVGMSLDPTLDVPIGLAMTCKQDRRRHGGYASPPWISDLSARYVW